MELLRRTPALGIFLALVFGIVSYGRAGGWAFVVVSMAWAGACFMSYENDLPNQWRVFAVGFVVLMMCSARIFFVLSAPDVPEENFFGEQGVISQVRTWGKIYVVAIDTKSHGRLIARFHFVEYPEGTRIKFDGTMRHFKTSRTPGGFDERIFWKARGAESWVSVRNVTKLPDTFNLYSFRYKIYRKLSIYFPTLTGEYLKAAWLGQRTDSLNEQHRRWGTSHLLAVSGFHVGIAVMCAMFLLGKNFLLLSLVMWAYVLLTGAAPSAMRAGLMFQIGLMASLLGRRVNGVNSVSVAAVLLLMFRPYLFWDIGFRLSVLSVLAITMLPREKFFYFFVGFAASAATLPQILATFKTAPYAGLVINIFAPFYFTFAFVIASVAGFLVLINFPVVKNFMFVIEGMFLLWQRVADLVANFIP
ncbi:MAG: ComEC/Rec2 family competence protein, partial [Synergistaceae bacterium]|nr:ComEC/Rec2 family competence protein [Synergistaceae bacterium]